MQRYRLLNAVVSIALIMGLSLGAASAVHAGKPDGAGKPAATGKPDGVGRPEGVGKPVDVGEPEGVGKPEDAGKPEGVGEPEDAGKPEGVGEPEDAGEPEDVGKAADVGRPEDLGTPPGLAKDKHGKGGESSDEDGYRYHRTGRAFAGEQTFRYQLSCGGLHVVVISDTISAVADKYCPSQDVLSATLNLTTGEPLTDILGTYVADLEESLENGDVAHFNFYGPLAWLNQFRTLEAVDEEEPETPEPTETK